MPVTVMPNSASSRSIRQIRPSHFGRQASVAAVKATKMLDCTVKKLRNRMIRVDTPGNLPLGNTSTLTPWITRTSCQIEPYQNGERGQRMPPGCRADQARCGCGHARIVAIMAAL